MGLIVLLPSQRGVSRRARKAAPGMVGKSGGGAVAITLAVVVVILVVVLLWPLGRLPWP